MQKNFAIKMPYKRSLASGDTFSVSLAKSKSSEDQFFHRFQTGYFCLRGPVWLRRCATLTPEYPLAIGQSMWHTLNGENTQVH